jgi:hypothetical protein
MCEISPNRRRRYLLRFIKLKQVENVVICRNVRDEVGTISRSHLGGMCEVRCKGYREHHRHSTAMLAMAMHLLESTASFLTGTLLGKTR